MAEGPSPERPLSERVRDINLIENALRRAVRKALLPHKQAGNPIAVGREGRVEWIAPQDIVVEEED
jgi:hypothetical protein